MMKPNEVTPEQLAEHIAKIDFATLEDFDDLLEFFLVKCWRTLLAQTN